MSNVSFYSYQIKGKGIGTSNVVPTINLAIPSSLDLPFGVYAARVTLEHKLETKKHGGALHYGPRLTDQDPSPSLELHVLDAQKFDTDYNTKEIYVEIVQFIRGIQKFDNFAQLRDQIQKDIVEIQEVLG